MLNEREEKDNEVSSKILNDIKRECNSYFSQAYKKICFEGKDKKVNHILQVQNLC